jgi:cell division protein ZipA
MGAPPPVLPAAPVTASRREPTLGQVREPPAAPSRVEVDEVAAAPAAPAPKPQRPAHKIIAIRVSATPPARFEGRHLLDALQSEGLAFGKYEIFHYLHTDGRPVFSAASLREPGTFEMDEMPATTYPGIALFSVLPGPVAAGEAFDQMLYTARALATLLQGALADERGVPLTTLRVGKLREDVLEFERGLPGDGPAG